MGVEDLVNLQANILKPHGRKHAWCIFIQLNGNREIAKDWIKQYAVQVTTASEQLSAIDRYKTQSNLPESARKKDYDKEMVRCLMLSATGYRKLGFSNEQMPKDKSFRAGLKNGNVNGYLGDPPSSQWEPYYSHSLDVMILLANDHERLLASEQISIMRSLMHMNAGTILFVEKGSSMRYKPNSKYYVEHFGFIDGISNPVFKFDEEKNLSSNPKEINLVLENDLAGGYGSYLVFRKLEQNVRAFNQQIEEIASELGLDKTYVEAQVIGRFKDGTPLEKSHTHGKGPEESPFDFKNDTEGKRCPFHAHIRKANPRVDPIVMDDESVLYPDRKRIVRRGITYGSRDKNLTDEPETGVGILFMCYQKSITEQFEVIQKEWCNNIKFFSPLLEEGRVTGLDPIIGQKINGVQTQLWNTSWHGAADSAPRDLRNFKNPIKKLMAGKPVASRRSFRNVVTLKGGEYFFAPSISFLRNPTPVNSIDAIKSETETVVSTSNVLNLSPFINGGIAYP